MNGYISLSGEGCISPRVDRGHTAQTSWGRTPALRDGYHEYANSRRRPPSACSPIKMRSLAGKPPSFSKYLRALTDPYPFSGGAKGSGGVRSVGVAGSVRRPPYKAGLQSLLAHISSTSASAAICGSGHRTDSNGRPCSATRGGPHRPTPTRTTCAAPHRTPMDPSPSTRNTARGHRHALIPRAGPRR